ncbi:hypothetical protein [Micromonospora sp. NPDC047730]|uniref:hypothetical protein n=1 Tax=Micromonospora sp. NPDC047730 TaxID=3364253 RepID=UPI003712AA1A
MSDSAANMDAEAAARLVDFGLRTRQVPDRDRTYGELVRRYLQDTAFAQLVRAIASGFGLVVLDVSRRGGIVVVPTTESVFETKMEDYARQARVRERRDTEKVLHGIVHLAVAALSFPRPADLADDSYVGRVSVAYVDAMVRETCRVLEERVTQAGEREDPSAEAPELEQVWRAYSRRPETATTRDSRLNAGTTRGMVSRALRWLADRGLLVQVGEEGNGVYRTTSRYQIQARELAAESAFRELLSLGVVPPLDGEGALAPGVAGGLWEGAPYV